VLRKSHLGLIGQTPEIAPADRKLYALRDVTSTVESRPLIAASIMSKKMAEGIDALVLDVKTGDGAFMVKEEDSRALAEAMLAIGRGYGQEGHRPHHGHGAAAGPHRRQRAGDRGVHRDLAGQGPGGPRDASVELAAWMLCLVGVPADLGAARARVREALASGAGLRKFQEIIGLQGGDPRVCDDVSRLPRAAQTVELHAESAGRVTGIACRAVGTAAMLLGAGRETVDSKIDPAVGLVLRKKVGDTVSAGEPLATVHVNDRGRLDEALAMLAPRHTRRSRSPAAATARARRIAVG